MVSHKSTHGLPKQDTDRGEDGIMSDQDTCNYSVMNFQQEYQLGDIMCVFMDSPKHNSHLMVWPQVTGILPIQSANIQNNLSNNDDNILKCYSLT